MKAVKVMIAAIAMVLSAGASAECYVNVQVCKPLGIRTLTSFQDTDSLANDFAPRCLERARQYLDWCNSGPQTVSSAFSNKGVITIGVSVNAAGSSFYTFDKNNHVVYLKSGY
jgi:hypothetical protein